MRGASVKVLILVAAVGGVGEGVLAGEGEGRELRLGQGVGQGVLPAVWRTWHRGGYDAFSYDITDALKSEGAQELVVNVTDATGEKQARGKQINEPKGIFYTPCTGIWQTVWIEPVAKSFISDLVIVPDVDAKV